MAETPIFTGERMRCIRCTRTQFTHPHIESGWYALEVDGRRVYCCPPCLGNRATPQCGRCRKFYHENYPACPWCAAEGAPHGESPRL
jgi:hypothetical protein